MPSDLELLTAWKGGDKVAGSELCGRHFDTLFRFFSSKTHPNDVSDLVQKTLLAAVESIAGYRAEASIKSYLLGIARLQLFQHWKRRARDEVLDPGVSSVHDFDPSPSTLAAAREEQRLVLDALRMIPMDLQIALELHFWEEMSGSEIATVLEIPEGTVRSRLRRGLEALREALRELSSSERLLQSTLDDLATWENRLVDEKA
jgi:RNA polymerase sigma-70 factor (ECF subfamily)